MWSSALLSLLPPAHAVEGAVFAGLPPGALGEELPAARVQSARLGTTIDLPKGLLRIYVGPSEEAAAEWMADMTTLMERHAPEPVPELGEEAVAAGDGMVLMRDHNVGLLIEINDGARAWLDTVRAALVSDPTPWPAPASLQATDGRLVVVAPGTTTVTWVGGTLAPGTVGPDAPLAFLAPPRRIVTWDAYGRATVQDFDDSGAPLPTPPPRPQPDPDETDRPR